MPRDRSDHRSAGAGAGLDHGISGVARGWRRADWLEQLALDRVRAFGPQSDADLSAGLPVYLGFPWSAFIDSLKTPDLLEAPLLRSAWRARRSLVPQRAGGVTVCTHPDLGDHADLLVGAGVSDVFWTGAMPGDGGLPGAPGLRVHPFPALPGPDAPAAMAHGPGDAFALCPEAGNRPGLWAAVAQGLIPVLSLDGPLLPGDGALWRAAAVVHDGSGGALDALPARLAAIAADPQRLAAMQAALAGVRLIYGPGTLVHDVLVCLAERADPALRPPAPRPGDQSLFGTMLRRFGARAHLSQPEASLVLQQAGYDLLAGTGRDLVLAPGPQSAAAWRLIALARVALAGDSAALTRFDEILDLLRRRDLLPTRIGAADRTATTPTTPLRIHLLGPRGSRTPLAYAPLRRHLGDRVVFAHSPETADLLVTGWSRDLEDNAALLAGLSRKGVQPGLVVLSEEPLWDSLWSGDLSPRGRLLDCGTGVSLPYLALNHTNSDIFRFQALPWFILSDDRFAARHAMLMAPFAALSPRALLRHWQAVPLQAAFVAERRTTADYTALYPVEGVAGLSLYRSRVAELTPGPGVLRLGQGWPGTDTRRQDLPDWHLDKLARLHGKVRLCSAYENTLQADYITEKLFDAFAVGAIPVTMAGPGHRLFDLVPPEAMVNTLYCAPDVAAARIASFVPDLILAEAWLEAAQGLLARLRDPSLRLAECRRLADACMAELVRFARSSDTISAV